jgi:FtsZ-interacting cell division protein ZipA
MNLHRLEIYGIIIGLLIFGVWTVKKFSEAKLQAKAEQVLQDAKPAHQDAAQERQTILGDKAVTKSDLALAIASISQQKAAPVQTQVDYDKLTAMITAKLGPGYQVQVNKDAADPEKSTVTVSGKNAAFAVRNGILDCEADTTTLNACKKDSADNLRLFQTEQKDHQTTKNELLATQKLVKGTFWGNAGRGIKHSICGGGGTAVGIEVARKSDTKAGVIIGGATFGGCELLTHLSKH